MKELIIGNKPALCLHSALCTVNWQFSAEDICEMKAQRLRRKAFLCKACSSLIDEWLRKRGNKWLQSAKRHQSFILWRAEYQRVRIGPETTISSSRQFGLSSQFVREDVITVIQLKQFHILNLLMSCVKHALLVEKKKTCSNNLP